MLFLLLFTLSSILLAWYGERRKAQIGYLLTLILSIFMFYHHATDKLMIYL
jgi:hypothetical protein